jgi:hypothetical protein
MSGSYENQNPNMTQTEADVRQGVASTMAAAGRSQADAHQFIVSQAGPAGHSPVGGYQSPGGSQGQTDARVFD